MNWLICLRKCFCHTTMLNRKQFLPLHSLMMKMIAHVQYDVTLLFFYSCARSSEHRPNSEKPTLLTASVHVMQLVTPRPIPIPKCSLV